jgi:hypothetical protein
MVMVEYCLFGRNQPHELKQLLKIIIAVRGRKTDRSVMEYCRRGIVRR